MSEPSPWYETASLPALLRHARNTYGVAMRRALEDAGFDDVPKNGLYVIGGLAVAPDGTPLSQLVRDLRISKQSAGQLVDALVKRGYLQRSEDALDRRKLIVTLTGRGHAAAAAQTAARQRIDALLAQRIGEANFGRLRQLLAALVGIGRQEDAI